MPVIFAEGGRARTSRSRNGRWICTGRIVDEDLGLVADAQDAQTCECYHDGREQIRKPLRAFSEGDLTSETGANGRHQGGKSKDRLASTNEDQAPAGESRFVAIETGNREQVHTEMGERELFQSCRDPLSGVVPDGDGAEVTVILAQRVAIAISNLVRPVQMDALCVACFSHDAHDIALVYHLPV